jgi:hypothetical protein
MPKTTTSRHPKVELVPVKSSNIESIGYHTESSTLHVHFKGGGHYIYHNVKPAVYEGFLKSESKGKYLSDNIKRHYHHTKLK